MWMISVIAAADEAESPPPSTQPVDESPPAASPEPMSLISPARGLIRADELSFQLGIDAETARRTVRTDPLGLSRTRYDQKNTESRLQETLGLESSGSIFDERIMLYDIMARWGLSQERYTEHRPGPDISTSPDGKISEYDLRFQFFPQGKASGDAFASNLSDRLPRPFLPSLDRRRERAGGGLHFNDATLPMSLTYEHLFDEITSGSRSLVDDEERGEDTLRYEATWQQSETHALNLEFEHERRSDQYSGTRTRFDTERNYLALTDTIQFGHDLRSRFETLLRYEEEVGDLDRDMLELAPQLRLQHTDSLFSTYRAQFLKQSYQRLETETVRGDIDLNHEIADMLTSSIGVYGLSQDANEGANTNEWGGLANFSFQRDNRLGRFASNLSLQHSDTRNSSGRNTGVVVDESVTFRDPLPGVLSQSNVEHLSIFVRSADRGQIYLFGRDYLVITHGGITALQRLATGLIADKDTVLVSYTYRAYDSFNVSRDRMDWRVSQELVKDLEAYYALSLQEEDINRSRFLRFRERDINRHRVGLTYRQPRWSSGLELEYNDDSLDPYKAAHANGDITLLQDGRQQLSTNATYSLFRFDGRDFYETRQTSLLDMGLSYRYTFGTNLEANATAMYRFQNDSIFGETQGVDLTAGVSYRIGEFTVLVEAEYDMLDLPSSTDNSAGVWLKLRRNIPVIERRAER
ncbi:MAG: hypothetical protein IPK83_22635 [Planctomycetes bacterium]|nr:hypothetical protein [Planctomycetota bacterium]